MEDYKTYLAENILSEDKVVGHPPDYNSLMALKLKGAEPRLT